MVKLLDQSVLREICLAHQINQPDFFLSAHLLFCSRCYPECIQMGSLNNPQQKECRIPQLQKSIKLYSDLVRNFVRKTPIIQNTQEKHA